MLNIAPFAKIVSDYSRHVLEVTSDRVFTTNVIDAPEQTLQIIPWTVEYGTG